MTRRLLTIISGLGTALMAGACQTTASAEPAVLSETSPEVTAALSAAASKALNGVGVTLAPNVLTTSSTLVLETKIPKTMDRNRYTGLINDRARPAPDVFKLMKTGNSCYLLHEQSGQKMPLGNMKCQAL